MADSREIKKVMISSTSLDLPQHRAQVVEACLRQGLFPIDMKHLPAREITPLEVDQEMIAAADVYLGIYAFRYGSIADGEEKSYTELEFERAIARGIPCLIFLMSAEHPVFPRDVETTPGAQEKLAAFKARASKGRICKEFKSAEDLRSEVIDALSHWKEEQLRASAGKPAPSFHPPSNIPQAPKPYVAHPYVLLQTKSVIGRRAELNELTDWITKNEEVPVDTRIFSVVAIGGMGKSALTWKWFEDIAPNELPNLAGRMWWSFYESDAHWENFIIRALAYTAGMPESAVRQLPSPEREDRLLHLLDEQPFLLVLDGLERILLAYARMDAAHLPDDDHDQQTANAIADTSGLPDDVRETYLEKHRLRQCADQRAGAFLRKLTRVRASRVLLSTRLYPAELQTQTAQPLPGCHSLFLRGLTDDDALALWRGFIRSEQSGTSEQLLPLFRAFGNYPLLLRALAGEVARCRPAPGDFDRWRKDHPDFNPAALPLKNAKTHVLEYALRELGEAQRRVLHTLAAFRMPATWETLRALLAGKDQPCADDRALDTILTELEDRGLLGWDKRANRYDLHPIVRGVVWSGLTPSSQHGIYGELHSYFEAVPMTDWRLVDKYDQLTPAIEVYHALLGMKRFEDASSIFFDQLDGVTHNRLSASRQRIELLSPLVDIDEGTGLPPLQEPTALVAVFNALGRSCLYSGDLRMAVHYLGCGLSLTEQSPLLSAPDAFCLCDISNALRPAGHLLNAEATALRAIAAWRLSKRPLQETRSSVRLGLAFAARGLGEESSVALSRALRLATLHRYQQPEGYVSAALAQSDLWFGRFQSALGNARRAESLAEHSKFERDFARAARVHGEAALWMSDHTTALARLHFSLTHARTVNFVEEELPALTALAELHRQRKEYDIARELLEQVWVPAAIGPYPLWHADARNVLAQIERDLGNTSAAIEAAAAAYRLAWCDGPPYAYHYGLTSARRHLRELGAPEPQLPPFDETKFPPMPDVELNPKDEFWVDPNLLD